MERIRVPSGTAQKFELVFKKLQDAIAKNLLNRVDLFVKSYGAVQNINNSTPQTNNFRVSVLDATARQIQVGQAGGAKGLASGNNYIKLESSVSLTLPAGTIGVDGDTIYIPIMAEHRDAYGENVPVIDGFVYDESGNVAQAATAINDTTVIIQQNYPNLDAATTAVSASYQSRIPIALLKVERVAGEYTIQMAWTDHLGRSITDGVSDIRHLNRLLLNENLLDDSKLLFKDRDSTRAYDRAVNGNVTFQKRIQVDQSLSMTMGSRLALGGINGLVDETTTNPTMLTYPLISVYGTNALDTSLHLRTTATTKGTGPQLRFISAVNSMGITQDPKDGFVQIGPMNADNPELVDPLKGISISSLGDFTTYTSTALGLNSATPGNDDYNVKAYASMLIAKTLQAGKQMIVGRASWENVGFDTTDAGTYDTLEVANDTSTSSNRASILISQAAKGEGNRSALKFLVTDTSSGTFKNYIRMETTGAASPVLDIGSTHTSTGVDTRYARFDSSGNLKLEKNLHTSQTLTVTGATQLNSTLTVGVDNTGHDVKFIGQSSSYYMLWDESGSDLFLSDNVQLRVGDSGPGRFYHNGTDTQLTNISGDLNIYSTSGSMNLGVTTSIPINIGNATSEVTIKDNLTVTGSASLNSSVTLGTTTFDDITLNGYIASAIIPKTTNTHDLGTSVQEFKNLYLDGTAQIDDLLVDNNSILSGTLGVTGSTTLGGAFEVAGDSTFTNVATFTENLLVVDQVGIGYAAGTDFSGSSATLSVSNQHSSESPAVVNIFNSTNDGDAILSVGGPSSSGATRRFGLVAYIGSDSASTSFKLGRIDGTSNTMANTFLNWTIDGDATHDGDFTVHNSQDSALLTADIFRNSKGASFDDQVIVSKKLGIGYAYGISTSDWAEQLRLTNPDGINHVVLKLDQTTNELDSKIILHTKTDGGVDRYWGIVHEGNDQNLNIGTANSSNNLGNTFIQLNRSAGKNIFKFPVSLEDNYLSLQGGNFSATESTGAYSIFEVDATKKKVAIGVNAASTAAFTTTNGQQGDYDLVIASKDTAFKNANLAFITDHSSTQKEFEIELHHDNNHVNFTAHTEGQKFINLDTLGRVRSTFDVDTGNLTTKTLTLEGSLDNQAGNSNDPALIIPKGEFISFPSDNQSAHIHSHTASGGYFGIYSNVEPYSFNEAGDSTGTKTNASHGFAGIQLDTTRTDLGGQILFQTGRNDGSTDIANKWADTILQMYALPDGDKKLVSYGDLVLVDIDQGSVNTITNSADTSTIQTLSGDTLTYNEINLSNKLTADHIQAQTFEAGGIFAASGVGVVSITDRADINAPNADSILTFHHGDGGGQAMVFSQIENKLTFKRTDHNSFSYQPTTDPDLLAINYSASEPSVEIGGRLVAHSGIFNGDIDASTGTITSAILRSSTSEVYESSVTANLTVTNRAEIEELDVVSSLDLTNTTVNINPNTKFETTISGVARDGYLVVASGSNYYIGQGELGLAAADFPGIELITAPPEPTVSTNFRLTDVNPHEDTYQHKSRAILEWGYKNIVGVAGASTTVGGTTYPTFQATTNTGGDLIDLTDGGGIQRVSGRFLLFPSGKKHLIVAWENSSKIFTLAITYDGEAATVASPVKMVDSGSGYTVNVLKNLEGTGTYQPYQAFNLDSTYIDTPRYEMELALAGKYYFNITTTDGVKATESTLMNSGVFDPDGAAAGQGLTAYGLPYVNTLPYLTNLPTLSDHLSLDATSFGMNVTINGWGSTDNQTTLHADANQIAHQFEIGYTTKTAFDWNAVDTQRVLIPFTSANAQAIPNIYDSATYTVAVRPVQNQQVVYNEATYGIIKKSILAGGGGAPPNMSTVVTCPASLTAYSGVYTGQSNSATYDQATISGMSFYADSITGPVTVGYNEFAPQNSFTLITSASLSNNGLTIMNNSQYDGVDSEQASISMIVETGGTDVTELSGQTVEFTIGATELSRKIYETQLESDFILKKIVVDVDWASGLSAGTPGIIRVYPKGNAAAGDTIQLTANAGMFTQSIDLSINSGVEPNRTIIIDGFDGSASPNNNWSMTGTVTIYGQTYDQNTSQQQSA